MQDPDGEHDSPGNQEAPEPLCKAGEDVRQPRSETTDTNNPAHEFLLVVYKLIFTNRCLVRA